MNLLELPIGSIGIVKKVLPTAKNKKKFADMGIIAGNKIQVECYAPFGSLLLIKVLNSKLTIQKEEAKKILIDKI